jgi:thioredoxin reductase (NADPH)
LHRVVLDNTQDGDGESFDIDGAFIAIGHQPNSKIVEGQVELDEEGYVVTDAKSTRTKVPGVFAAGDLVDHTYRQAVTAAGSGCQAALDAEWYLRDRPPDPEAHWVAKDEAAAPAAPR